MIANISYLIILVLLDRNNFIKNPVNNKIIRYCVFRRMLKMRQLKMRHQTARIEIARHENLAPNCKGAKCEK